MLVPGNVGLKFCLGSSELLHLACSASTLLSLRQLFKWESSTAARTYWLQLFTFPAEIMKALPRKFLSIIADWPSSVGYPQLLLWLSIGFWQFLAAELASPADRNCQNRWTVAADWEHADASLKGSTGERSVQEVIYVMEVYLLLSHEYLYK